MMNYPINEELVTLQMVLSKLIDAVMNLKAGNIQFKKVMNFNQ